MNNLPQAVLNIINGCSLTEIHNRNEPTFEVRLNDLHMGYVRMTEKGAQYKPRFRNDFISSEPVLENESPYTRAIHRLILN